MLTDDIEAAAGMNMHSRPCQLCVAMTGMSDSEIVAIEKSFGLVGANKLSEILKRNGYTVNRRAIIRHRTEKH